MQDARYDDEPRDMMALTETRRGLFRRSLLGITGLGLAGTLVACGDDDDNDEPVTTGQGAEDPGEEPGIGEETGIGEDGEDDGTEESVSEEEGLDGDEEDDD